MRDLCSRERLRGLAGARSFERGEEYALEGRVERLTVSEGSATATVVGAAPYRVTLRRDPAGALTGACTCPVDAFCKHCVAVGLAVAGEAGLDRDELRAYVSSRSHAELVELVLGALERDGALRAGLQLDMAAAAGDSLAAAIDDAAFVPDHLRWDDVWAYAERLDAVLDALGRRLAGGHAGEVVALAEHFATSVARQLEYVDDSSGAVGSTIARAEALHRTACRRAAPDPVALAERLFELETSTDLFQDALETHADVLGDAGRAHYAELADAAWANGSPSWTLTRIMERLAAGDVDRLVAIKARTVAHSRDYLEIATLLRDAGRLEDAIGWAERGAAAAPDARLREFLADSERQAGRPEAALAQRAGSSASSRRAASGRAIAPCSSRSGCGRVTSLGRGRRRTPAAARVISGERWRASARTTPSASIVGCCRRRSTCATTTAMTGRSSCWPSCTSCSRRSAVRPSTRRSSPRSARSIAARRT